MQRVVASLSRSKTDIGKMKMVEVFKQEGQNK